MRAGLTPGETAGVVVGVLFALILIAVGGVLCTPRPLCTACPLPLAAPPRVLASRVTDGAYNSKKVKKATATIQEPTFKSVASEGGTEMEAKS